MIELDKVTADTFKPHLDSVFETRAADGTKIELRLSSVAEYPLKHPDRRHGFSLYFSGPNSPRLAQRTYELEHPALGVMSIFLVPVQPDARGPLYEAVFN